MAFQHSEDVQKILDTWLEEIQKLVDNGKASALLTENVRNLISDGKLSDIDRVRLAIELGVKNVESN